MLKAMRDAKGPATTRLLAARACVGLEAARHTLDNLVRAGVADKPGTTRVPGVRRPVPLYALRVPVQLNLPGVIAPGLSAGVFAS